MITYQQFIYDDDPVLSRLYALLDELNQSDPDDQLRAEDVEDQIIDRREYLEGAYDAHLESEMDAQREEAWDA
jgi:hypothetical protein